MIAGVWIVLFVALACACLFEARRRRIAADELARVLGLRRLPNESTRSLIRRIVVRARISTSSTIS